MQLKIILLTSGYQSAVLEDGCDLLNGRLVFIEKVCRCGGRLESLSFIQELRAVRIKSDVMSKTNTQITSCSEYIGRDRKLKR